MNVIVLLKTSQIIICALLIFLVLIQAKGTGLTSGLKSSFGAYRSLRGIEKAVFVLTITSAVLLVLNSLGILLLS